MTPFGTIRIEDGCCANNNVFSQEVAFHVRDAFASQLGNEATDPFHFSTAAQLYQFTIVSQFS